MKKQFNTIYVYNSFCTAGGKIASNASLQDYLKWRAFIHFINSKTPEHQRRSGTDTGAWYGLKDGVGDGTSTAPYNNDEIATLDFVIEHFNIEYPNPDDYVTLYNNQVALREDSTLITSSDSLHEGQYARHSDIVEVDSMYGGGTAVIDECSTTLWGDRWFVTDERHQYNIVWSEYNDGYIDENDDDVYYGVYDRRGNTGYFCSEDYVHTEDTHIYYADASVAESNGCWCDGDGDWYGSRESVRNNNANYHDLDRKFRCDLDSTPFRVGFEIEKEDGDAGIIHYSDLYSNTDWIKENDGSLGDNGYELITPTFDLFSSDLDNDIKKYSDLRTLINGDFSSRCGGHINLSARDYKAEHLFEGVSGFFPLLYAMYENRLGQTYCEAKQKHVYYRRDKYSAVYLKSELIEFRIFPAVRSVSNLLWRRDLIRIICKNINADEIAVIKMMATPSSELYKHLRKVFSQEQIIAKIGLFITYADLYCNKKIQPPKNLDNLKKNKDRYPDVNGTSGDLGA